MQVFVTDANLKISAQSLDDARLNAQLKEITQLLCGMENLKHYVCDNNVKIEHSNHPVFKNYNTPDGKLFLTCYLSWLCKEYYFRFKKHHQAFFTCYYFMERYENELCYSLFADFIHSEGYCGHLINTIKYIKGQKGKGQIITHNNACGLYRELLCSKWNDDIVKPKWTNRGQPKWYIEYRRYVEDINTKKHRDFMDSLGTFIVAEHTDFKKQQTERVVKRYET